MRRSVDGDGHCLALAGPEEGKEKGPAPGFPGLPDQDGGFIRTVYRLIVDRKDEVAAPQTGIPSSRLRVKNQYSGGISIKFQVSPEFAGEGGNPQGKLAQRNLHRLIERVVHQQGKLGGFASQ